MTDDLHALFDVVVLVCPNGAGEDDVEACGHEYTDDEVEEMHEAQVDGWWSGCPDCHVEVSPVPTRVNRLDQFAEARVELDETLAFLRERRPDMADRLDEAERLADETVDRILAR